MPRGTDRYDEARLQGRLWTPAANPSILGAWFDSADLGTIAAASGTVSQWSDKSPNARHATQGTGANQPTIDSSYFGFPTIYNNGSSSVNLGFSGSFMAGTAYTIVMAAFRTSTSRSHMFGGTAGGTNLNLHGGWLGNTTAEINHYANDLSFSIPAYDVPRIHIFSANLDTGSGRRAWYDRSASNLSSDTSTLISWAGSKLFSSAFAAGYGGICEIVFIPSLLSTINRNKFEGYMAWKWQTRVFHGVNLPASHPFANRPPLIGD